MTIQLFLEKPPLKIEYSWENSLSELFNAKDLNLINHIWEHTGNSLSESREYATLWDTKEGVLIYHKTSYKEYFGVTRAKSLGFKIRPGLYSQMRISSVGAALFTKDNKVCLQRRQEGLLAAGYLDSSAAGLCKVQDQKLDFEGAIREKLSRELRINNKSIKSIIQSGAHSSSDYCSGMITYVVHTNLSFNEIKKQTNKEYVSEIIDVNLEDLPEFIINHYIKKEDLIGDGCATLLRSLEEPVFKSTVQEINKTSSRILLGTLTQGKFIKI